jgi:hypothetical protein
MIVHTIKSFRSNITSSLGSIKEKTEICRVISGNIHRLVSSKICQVNPIP